MTYLDKDQVLAELDEPFTTQSALDYFRCVKERIAALPAIPLNNAGTRTFTMFRRGDLSETHDENQRPPAPDEPNFWGVVWPDGTCTLRWCGAVAATSVWASFDDAMKVHGHFGDKHDPLLVWDSGALPVLETPPCDHIIQLGFYGAIQMTPETCHWCHPELQQKTSALVEPVPAKEK